MMGPTTGPAPLPGSEPGGKGLSDESVAKLSRLPGFRNVPIHEYVALDYGRVVEAIHNLEPVEEFLALLAARFARD